MSQGRQILGRGYRWWDKRWENGASFTRGDYFVFAEEGSAVSPEGLLGPDGSPIDFPNRGEKPWRFRFAGIALDKFLFAARRVDLLGPDDIEVDNRHKRRSQLLDAFGNAPLPLIDILVEHDNPELAFLRSALTPGSWHWIGVRRRRSSDNRLAVYIGAPDVGPDPLAIGALQFLEAVPPYFEYQLRDIFSLAHILDAGEEEDLGGEGAPPPVKPRDDGVETELPLYSPQDRARDRDRDPGPLFGEA